MCCLFLIKNVGCLFSVQIDLHPPTSVLRNQSLEHAQPLKSHVPTVKIYAVHLYALGRYPVQLCEVQGSAMCSYMHLNAVQLFAVQCSDMQYLYAVQ